jgi:streptogramin lyase
VIDEPTGQFTIYNIPEQNAAPYDVQPDPDGNHIWFPDSPTPDRAAEIGRLNRKDGTFTFYPKVQFDADSPKIQITRDGAVWYAPRGSDRAPGITVLFPDKNKITGLGAYYVNGPPGYPFKTPADVGQSSTGKSR